jgi:hypothetical protein
MKNRKRIEMQNRMLKGVALPRYKDKYGNNIKQIYGIWKYFINTQTMKRDKFYISLDCRRLEGKEAN